MVIRRAAIGIALALLAACGQGGPSARPAARATQERASRLESTLNVMTGAPSIYSLTGWNHYIAWAAQTRADSPPNRVVVYDLTTKTKRIVARTTSSSSEIDYLRGDEDTLVYAEL